jgi:hypothetical protein
MPLDDLQKRNREIVKKWKKQDGNIEKIAIYPAGRGKKLIIKTVESRGKIKTGKNPRRLCICNIPSNPQNIKVSVLKKADKNYQVYLYPEGRRLSSDEFNDLLASLFAFRIFKKRGAPSTTLFVGKNAPRYRFLLQEKELVAKINLQLKRLIKQYGKFKGEGRANVE